MGEHHQPHLQTTGAAIYTLEPGTQDYTLYA